MSDYTAEAKLYQLEIQARCDSDEIRRLRTGFMELEAKLAEAQKWSGLWKRLAKFRGWPASKHERNRAEVERLREAGDQLARALDGTRYAMEERKAWVAALRGGGE